MSIVKLDFRSNFWIEKVGLCRASGSGPATKVLAVMSAAENADWLFEKISEDQKRSSKINGSSWRLKFDAPAAKGVAQYLSKFSGTVGRPQ